MANFRVTQYVAIIVADTPPGIYRVSQLVRLTSTLANSAFCRSSQVARLTSAITPVATFHWRMSQLVRLISTNSPGPETACDVDPVSIEASQFALMQPDWSRQVEMETAWLTDITASKAELAEDRRMLQRRPLRHLTALVSGFLGADPTRVAHLIARLGNNRNPFPLYQDRRTLQSNATTNTLFIDTTNRRFYKGQRVGIAYPDGSKIATGGEGLEAIFMFIDTVFADHLLLTANLPTTILAGADIYPMIDAEIVADTKVSLATDMLSLAEVSVLETSGCQTLPGASDEDVSALFDYFGGYPILDVTQNWAGQVEYTITRVIQFAQTGRTQIADRSGTRAVSVFPMDFGPLTRPEFWKLLSLHDSRAGRGRPFWLVHPQTLWKFVGMGTTFIDVEPWGYTGDIPAFHEHLYLEEVDGTVSIVNIIAASIQTSPLRIRITTNAIPATNPVRVTAALLCREDTDTATESWATEEICASFKMTFRELTNEEVIEIT